MNVLDKNQLDELSFRKEAEVLRALGHPLRLKIVYGLLSGECNVKNMQECLNIPQAKLSQHLAVLKSVGVIEGDREGNQVIYRVTNDLVYRVMEHFSVAPVKL